MNFNFKIIYTFVQLQLNVYKEKKQNHITIEWSTINYNFVHKYILYTDIHIYKYFTTTVLEYRCHLMHNVSTEQIRRFYTL